MTLARHVQNFARRRAVIVSDDGRAVGALTGPLTRLGLTVARAAQDEVPALERERDVLYVDGDLDLPGALVEATMPPVPVVGLVGVEAPSRLKALMSAGATAFLQKPVYGGSVYSSLYLAVNEHARRSELAAAVAELETRRHQRRHVIKAVVAVMNATGLDDDAAFQVLRREATRARVSLEQHCEELVLTDVLLHGPARFGKAAAE